MSRIFYAIEQYWKRTTSNGKLFERHCWNPWDYFYKTDDKISSSVILTIFLLDFPRKKEDEVSANPKPLSFLIAQKANNNINIRGVSFLSHAERKKWVGTQPTTNSVMVSRLRVRMCDTLLSVALKLILIKLIWAFQITLYQRIKINRI